MTERQSKKCRLTYYSGDDDYHNVGGPIEDVVTAKQKLIDAGFDVDKYNINTEQRVFWYLEEIDYDDYVDVTPLIYFCYQGDVPMCRYVFLQGADCTQGSQNDRWFPMYVAALKRHVDVCQWLYEHGGATIKGEIRRESLCHDGAVYDTPLCASFNNFTRYNKINDNESTTTNCMMSKWLIVNGALGEKNSDNKIIDANIMRLDLTHYNHSEATYKLVDERPQLLSWAQETIQLYSTFLLFLGGTVIVAHQNNSSPLKIFNGKSGILELIGEYAGFERRVYILRQFADHLSKFIEDEPPSETPSYNTNREEVNIFPPGTNVRMEHTVSGFPIFLLSIYRRVYSKATRAQCIAYLWRAYSSTLLPIPCFYSMKSIIQAEDSIGINRKKATIEYCPSSVAENTTVAVGNPRNGEEQEQDDVVARDGEQEQNFARGLYNLAMQQFEAAGGVATNREPTMMGGQAGDLPEGIAQHMGNIMAGAAAAAFSSSSSNNNNNGVGGGDGEQEDNDNNNDVVG